MDRTVTLREVVAAVAEFAQSENEVVATIVHLVNTGQIRLHGDLAGAQIDMNATVVSFARSRLSEARGL